MNANNVKVEGRDGEHPERLIKKFSRMCQKFGITKEYKKRKHHVKDSIKLKEKREKAEKRRLKDARRKNVRSKI